MKTTLKLFITLFSIVLFHNEVRSQQGAWKFDLGYSVGIPLAEFKNLTDQPSGRGWNAAVLYGATDRLSLGLTSGFQDFYQKYSRTVLHDEGSDLSAVITNSVQTIPVMLKAKYIFSREGTIRPFGSIAAGVNFARYEKYYGQFVDSYSKVGFAARPELGIHLPIGAMKRTGLELAAAYNIMPFKYNDADGFNYVGIKLGVSIPMQR